MSQQISQPFSNGILQKKYLCVLNKLFYSFYVFFPPCLAKLLINFLGKTLLIKTHWKAGSYS